MVHIFAYVKKLDVEKLEERIQRFWYAIGHMATELYNSGQLRDGLGRASDDKGDESVRCYQKVFSSLTPVNLY